MNREKRASVVGLVVIVAFVLLAPGLAEGQLTNPGFDSGTSGWEVSSPAFWTNADGHSAFGSVEATQECLYGNCSASILTAGCLPILPGSTFDLGIWARTVSGSGAAPHMSVWWWSSGTCDSGGSLGMETLWGHQVVVGSDWVERKWTGIVAPASARGARVYFSFVALNGGATMRFDDAFFELQDHLIPPAGPNDVGSARFTLRDVWNRLATGAAGAKRGATFSEPAAGPTTATMKTTDEIMSAAPAADNTSGATAADVLAGRTFWALRTSGGAWGKVSGTMVNRGAVTIVPGASTQAIAAGYHDGSGTVPGDPDLSPGNIRAGVNVFGVDGALTGPIGDAAAAEVLSGKTFSNASASGVVGTMTNRGAVTITPGVAARPIDAGYHNGTGTVEGDADLIPENIKQGVSVFGVTGTATGGGASYAAGVEKTGQTQCYKYEGSSWVIDTDCATNTPANQDGKLRKGVAWPNPRFTKNGNGTVTDNLTGLIWLENANCFGTQTWVNAMGSANGLATGSCGLTDSSAAGDWRLPNVKELQSLIDYAYAYPALSNTAGTGQWTAGDPFTNVQSNYYWSSSSYVSYPAYAWLVYVDDGNGVSYDGRTLTYNVWPVRGGQ